MLTQWVQINFKVHSILILLLCPRKYIFFSKTSREAQIVSFSKKWALQQN
jgi:hypothetical protein